MYSGQSQIAYEVYELEPLRHVLSVPYRFGEGDPPVFSSDGSLLAMAWATNPELRGWDEGGAPTPERLDELGLS